MTFKIDLHSHSTVSDGVLTPSELMERAHANGVQVIALTDHDEISGLAEAESKASELGLKFVNGIEISVTWLGRTVHIVGLGIDPTNKILNKGIQTIRSGRAERAKLMGMKLEELGFSGAYEGARKLATNPSLISRTHFARFLVQNGYCPNMQVVFDKYLGDHKQADVPVEWAKLEEAVYWITSAGGQAVIAHPGRYKYKPSEFRSLYKAFVESGGEAIEVITGSHRPDQYAKYADVARKYGFLASVGSDFHEVAPGRLDLGELPPLPDDLTPVWHNWF